jgi:hypothetical protein
MFHFLDDEGGQVIIYEYVNVSSLSPLSRSILIASAVNPNPLVRREWKNLFDKHEIQLFFVESWCNDEDIIMKNIMNVKISSPDVFIV